MKIDWEVQGFWGIYLSIGAIIVAIVWRYFGWPWERVVNSLPLLFGAYAFLAGYFVKRRRLRGKRLKEEIRTLGDELTLQDDFTIDDLDALYEVEELEQIIIILKAMPIGQRKLQDAAAVIEKNQA